jgi:DNA-binding response OmpR family regulator
MDARKTCHALVIEDDEPLALQFAEALGDAGLRTTIAHDGMTGLEAQDRDPADLVLLDLKLPDMDGSHVALDLHARYPTLPIIVVTGDLTRLSVAVTHLLQKPVRAKEIQHIAARYCPRASGRK